MAAESLTLLQKVVKTGEKMEKAIHDLIVRGNRYHRKEKEIISELEAAITKMLPWVKKGNYELYVTRTPNEGYCVCIYGENAKKYCSNLAYDCTLARVDTLSSMTTEEDYFTKLNVY